MNPRPTPQEAELHYPHGDQLPPLSGVMSLAPGIRWLRMGLPFALDHINLWLLRDRDAAGREGWTVVDCGIDDAPTRAAWEQVIAQALGGLPVLRVIVTHMHPDHLGLAHWLTERFGCRLWISATDWHAAQLACHSPIGFGGEAAAAFFERHGLRDAATLAHVRGRSGHYAELVPEVPAQYHRLMHGQVVTVGGEPWHCIVGHGHAPEHIALYNPQQNVLISGDMVLPRISTNVSVGDHEPEADSLTRYLESLQAYLALPADTLVLPSHGKPFTGLHTRVAQLQAHHAERLAEAEQACREAPCSAADLLPVLFRRALDPHQTTFAMGESVAHLHALVTQGRARPVQGADGVLRFVAAVNG